jgi:hypothetical protein
MSDIDVINYAFPPQAPYQGPVLFSFHGFVPALVTGSRQSFEAVIDAFIKVSKNLTAAAEDKAIMHTPDGSAITSDMVVLLSRPDLYLNLHFPMSIMGPELNKTALLHFDKAEVITWAARLGVKARKSLVIPLIRDYRKGHPAAATGPG